jgi:hypothetical protein
MMSILVEMRAIIQQSSLRAPAEFHQPDILALGSGMRSAKTCVRSDEIAPALKVAFSIAQVTPKVHGACAFDLSQMNSLYATLSQQ